MIPGTGTYFVGIDMPAGRYRCTEGRGGWWVLFRGEAGDRPVGAWPLGPGPAEVDISPGDFAFETHVPSSWTLVAPAGEAPGTPRPVADPTLRTELDSLVARRGPLLRLAPPVLAALSVAAFLLLGGAWLWLALPLMVVAFCSRRLLDDVRRARALGDRADRYLLPEDFDDEASALLVRVQRAAEQVRGAQVVREGVLEGLDPQVELPRQEWEIAQVLARHSRLRRDAEALEQAPELAALREAQREKLQISVAAVARRIEALERYARSALEADAAYRACHALEALAERDLEYDELLADTVRDELEVPAIDHLTEQSDELLRTLRHRLAEATEAARSTLPPEEAGRAG
ncbi:hypothetical protein ABGB12_06975 [Actinocorallia sp. B10E7]|uniref:hypothetical protein n=1 Tax=Actinocorallia sp. B10E7 TaxID=3153558 RepID=UPI00325D5E8B